MSDPLPVSPTTDQGDAARSASAVAVMVDVVSYCLKQPALVAEFNRLTGRHIGEPRSGLDRAIDEATGYYDMQLQAFAKFVVEFITEPWLASLPAAASREDRTP